MRFQSYIKVSVSLIQNYEGKEPLALHLKSYFSKNKKHGSKDRKWISHFCYCYFRIGHALKNLSVEERLSAAILLCTKIGQEVDDILEDAGVALAENLPSSFEIENIFPWSADLSDGIDHVSFCRSFLCQPDLFIRLRPGYEATTKQKLSAASIPFREISSHCLALNNATKVDTLLKLNKEVVIQDYNSQRVGGFFRVQKLSGDRLPRIWDCCCASGGKSILAYDILPDFDLTVSDIRKSILHNLKKRFNEAGIRNYTSFTADLRLPQIQRSFDLIIADLPCSGSGTWSRTPEGLYFFDIDQIGHYAALQKSIISNLVPHLKKGGRLVYMTCSVFKKENEDIVRFIEEEFNLKKEREEILGGWDIRADTMFIAAFQL